MLLIHHIPRPKVQEEQIHLALILNHDHIWKSSYRPKPRAVRKQRQQIYSVTQPSLTCVPPRSAKQTPGRPVAGGSTGVFCFLYIVLGPLAEFRRCLSIYTYIYISIYIYLSLSLWIYLYT